MPSPASAAATTSSSVTRPTTTTTGRLAPHLAGLLTDDGLLVYETSGRAEPLELPGLEARTSRKYGSARLTLYET